MSLQRSPSRCAIRRLSTPIRRAIRRRPSPGLGAAAVPAAMAPGCSAAAWVRVPERRGGWPEVRARSERGALPRRLRSHRSSRYWVSWRRSAPAEVNSHETRP